MKPYVICHMAATIDGRTVLDRWRPKREGVGGLFDRVHEQLGGDAWLFGRVTGQELAKGTGYPARTARKFPREPWFATHDAGAYGVVLDPHGEIAWGRSDVDGDPIVVVLTERVGDAHLAGLRADGVSYVFAGEAALDLPLTLATLNRELGVKRLLLEGGGITNGSFLRAGLVDEVSLLVFPCLDGSPGASSVFDAASGEDDRSPPLESVELTSSQAMEDGVVWLRYRIRNRGG